MFLITVNYWADGNPWKHEIFGPFLELSEAEERYALYTGLRDSSSGITGEDVYLYLFSTEGTNPLSYLG